MECWVSRDRHYTEERERESGEEMSEKEQRSTGRGLTIFAFDDTLSSFSTYPRVSSFFHPLFKMHTLYLFIAFGRR